MDKLIYLHYTFAGYLDHVTVLIGVAVKGRAVGGVIHQPYYNSQSSHVGRTVWGIVGLGWLFFLEPIELFLLNN